MRLPGFSATPHLGAAGPLPVDPDARSCQAAADHRRAWRVAVLTIAIALMSLADLQITLTYLRSVGMSEDNPLARWVMSTRDAGTLIRWKLMTVALACSIFLFARRFRSAEIGAWMCCGVLVWLTIRWQAYSHEVAVLTPNLPAISQCDSTRWVVFPE